MELSSFIEKTLVEITEGVKAAEKRGVEISTVGTSKSGGVNADAVKAGVTPWQKVEFDLLVTTSEKSGKENGITILAAVIGGKLEESKESTGQRVNRLKFTVPISIKPFIGNEVCLS